MTGVRIPVGAFSERSEEMRQGFEAGSDRKGATEVRIPVGALQRASHRDASETRTSGIRADEARATQ